MKKIAYLGINQRGGFRRAEAFIKHGPQYEHTFVIFLEYEGESPDPKYQIPYPNVRYITFDEFDFNDYDLVLHMNDKLFKHVLKNIDPSIEDMADKNAMERAAKVFGFPMLRTEGFADDDLVILKPISSSGSYSKDTRCYSKIKFADVKSFVGDTNFIIQEFVDTKDVVMFSTISNGKGDFYRCDVVDYEYVPDRKGQFFPQYMESRFELIPHYSEMFDKIEAFMRFISYDKLKTIANIQFLKSGDEFFIMDFNTRTGPNSAESDINNIMDPRVYRLLPFLLGEKSAEECVGTGPFENYLFYVEEDGKIVTTKRPIVPDPKRVCISEDKTSGAFRNDYINYMQKG